MTMEEILTSGLAELGVPATAAQLSQLRAYYTLLDERSKVMNLTAIEGEEATARLTALSEFQDLGSGMRIAMRDLEIRGAGSLMGAEQHGNLSSVGFDLFTQMLGQAVAEARGDDDAGVEAASVGINLPADYFLSEEYLPAVDQRVLVYRKLTAAEDLESIDEVQEETEAAAGRAQPVQSRAHPHSRRAPGARERHAQWRPHHLLGRRRAQEGGL